ncbi:lanthionine synthetase C family protein [Bacillus luti]|uniref:lanthionine synthetase C family protein n=1 Tax=Bacillus luti TaxID=2026191 RepID=UPI003D06A9A5
MRLTTEKKSFWLQGISIEKRNKALKLVRDIAERLKDPMYVEKIVMEPDNIPNGGTLHPWDPITLSHGYPGTIMLFAELDRQFPEEGWDLIAHSHLIEIQKAIEKQGVNSISMFGGVSGIAYATSYASRNYERYHIFLKKLNEFVLSQLHLVLNYQKEECGVHPFMYDTIQGATGVGRYLLQNIQLESNLEALKKILNCFINMSNDIEVNGEVVPGWYVPYANQFLETDKILFPDGNFNCGHAHGIPGPLSLMALAIEQGIEVPGQKQAIRKMIDWLIRWQDEGSWPARLSFKEVVNDQAYHVYPKRKGWCYGNPGVARALYLAGRSLKDQKSMKIALSSYQDTLLQSEEEWDLASPTFCHGRAGLLQMSIRMAKDENGEVSMQSIIKLIDYVMDAYDPQAPFGFKDLQSNEQTSNELNKVGLLEGVSGVLLTLLSLSAVEEPWWDGVFLIS